MHVCICLNVYTFLSCWLSRACIWRRKWLTSKNPRSIHTQSVGCVLQWPMFGGGRCFEVSNVLGWPMICLLVYCSTFAFVNIVLYYIQTTLWCIDIVELYWSIFFSSSSCIFHPICNACKMQNTEFGNICKAVAWEIMSAVSWSQFNYKSTKLVLIL